MKQLIPFHKEIVFRTMIGEITSISLEHTLTFDDETTIRGDFIVSGTYKMTEASQIEEDFDYHLPVDIEVSDRYDIKNSKIEIDDFYYEIVNDEILKVNIDVLLEGVEPAVSVPEETVPVPEKAVRVNDEEIVVEKEKEVGNRIETISLDEEVIKSHLEKELVRENEKEQDSILVEVPVKEDVREEMIDNEIPILQAEEPSLEQVIPNKEEIAIPKKEEKMIEINQKEPSPSIDSIFSCFKDTDETFSTYSVYIVRENDTLEGIMDRYHCNKEQLSNYNNLDELTLGTKLIIPCSLTEDA